MSNKTNRINYKKDLYMKQIAIAADTEGSLIKFRNENYKIDKIYVSPYSSEHYAIVSELRNPNNTYNLGLDFDYDNMVFKSNGLMEIPM